MKVLLLNAPYKPNYARDMRWNDTGRGGTLYYPVWLAYATGILEQAGFECDLIDCATIPADCIIFDTIQLDQYCVVIIDTSFPSLNVDIEFVKELKRYLPRIIMVMVGAPCSQFADKMLNAGIDYVCRWEFDFVLRDLLTALRDGKDTRYINGVSVKICGNYQHNPYRPWSTGPELDSIPFVSSVYKKHLDITKYMLNYSHSLVPEVQIFTSRGCGYGQCAFCNWPQTLMGRKYRARSVDNVIAEFQWIESNMPEVKQVFIEDDTFTSDKKRVIEFCAKYLNSGLHLPWGAQARVGLDVYTMCDMKRANCMMIDVGYESGNDNILKTCKKGITTEQIRDFAKDARDAGMSVHGNWIIGLPGENKETIKQTWNLIKETKADAITVAVVSPFPGTEMYNQLKTSGNLITDDPNEYLDAMGHQKSIVSYPGLSAEEIKQTVDSFLKKYYLSFSYVPIALRRILSPNGWNELKVLWRSAKAFLKYLREK